MIILLQKQSRYEQQFDIKANIIYIYKTENSSLSNKEYNWKHMSFHTYFEVHNEWCKYLWSQHTHIQIYITIIFKKISHKYLTVRRVISMTLKFVWFFLFLSLLFRIMTNSSRNFLLLDWKKSHVVFFY